MALTKSAPMVPHGALSPRVVVVLGPGLVEGELRRAQREGPWAVYDARSEDPFACAEELAASAAAMDPDLVVCLGGRTLTAEAVALLCDAPLASTRTLTPTRMASLDAAWIDRSELRRAVLDVWVDGCHRFATGYFEVTGKGLDIAGLATSSAAWSPQRQPLRVGPRGIGSRDVLLHDGAGGHAQGQPLQVTAGDGCVGIRGRHQRFRHVEVAVHPSPLRQLVAATSSRRRPVVDTAPL